jgi:tetratricopeptide (TPR) repeat protein
MMWRCGAILSFLIVLVCSPTTVAQSATAIQTELQGANALLQQGRSEEARRELLRVTRTYPASPEAFALLGIAEMQLHHLAAAENSLRKALRLNPRLMDALYNLGVLLLDAHRPKESLAYFDQAAHLGPPAPELFANQVRASLDIGDRQNASKLAERAGKTFEASAPLNLALGNVFLAHGMPAEAREYLRRADRLAPSQPEILLPLADACLQLHDVECGNAALERSRSKSAGDARFQYLDGLAAFLSNRLDDGFREMEKAVGRDPSNLTYLLALARYCQKFGQQQKAIALFERAQAMAPGLVDIPYGLAVSYFIQDNFTETIEYSTRALKIDPEFDRAVFLLGISRFAKSELADAEQLLVRASSLKPTNAFYRCFLGMVLLSSGRPQDAEANFRESIRLDPSYALAYYQLGRTLQRSGRSSEAQPLLERAVSLKPDLAEAYYQLGLAYRRLGHAEKASQAFETFKHFKAAEQNERTEVLRQAVQSFQNVQQ